MPCLRDKNLLILCNGKPVCHGADIIAHNLLKWFSRIQKPEQKVRKFLRMHQIVLIQCHDQVLCLAFLTLGNGIPIDIPEHKIPHFFMASATSGDIQISSLSRLLVTIL